MGCITATHYCIGWDNRSRLTPSPKMHSGDKVAQLVRCRTSNQRVAGSIPATPGTLVVLGQNSLFHIASVYPAAKWVPSINKAVLRVCALYAASCSGISPGGLKWFLYVQAC